MICLDTDRAALVVGDAQVLLATIGSGTIDALVTDPPAGIGFMGKDWDGDKGGRDQWVAWLASVMCEALRVLKPGAHALVWALPRTSHWTATALEDAGFEVRDVVMHLFGTGFPKSLTSKTGMPEGQGTALKPAAEHWLLCRKPLVGTVARNVAAYGTGGLNIDGCRIAHASEADKASATPQGKVIRNNFAPGEARAGVETSRPDTSLGRWPAHLTLDEEAAALLDAQSGHLHARGNRTAKVQRIAPSPVGILAGMERVESGDPGDSGGASRFFYCAKPSRKERGKGNMHPTVKPVALMRWLCRLVTPPGGTILDPFAGSGTTGEAALVEGFGFIGFEQSDEYAVVAKSRLEAVLRGVLP